MSAAVSQAKILIAEEDSGHQDFLKTLFRNLEHRVKSAADEEKFVSFLRDECFDAVFCSIKSWNALVKEFNTNDLPPVIVAAAYTELEQAQDALKQGAIAVLPKPFQAQNALKCLEKALSLPSKKPGNAKSEEIIAKPEKAYQEVQRHFGLIIGEHSSMTTLYETIKKVSETNLTVLIRGESGTGKDLIARAVHGASSRSNRPFVAINCTAMPANLLESELFGHVKGAFTGALKDKIGLFKAADGGTIFLDEIGSIPVQMQLSLLKVLQDKTIRQVGSNHSETVDVRIIAATNENLEERIAAGAFREDLFFRLAAFPLTVPPLRERGDDILLLARTFLSESERPGGKTLVFSQEASDLLMRYPWPGNVREMINVIQRAVTVLPDNSTVVTPNELALSMPSTPAAAETPDETENAAPENILTLKAYLRNCERSYIKKVYGWCGEDKEKTAQSLGISLGTLYRKFEEQ